MKDKMFWFIQMFIMVWTIVGIIYFGYDAAHKASQIPNKYQVEIQQYRAEVEQLKVRVDANDAIVNRWLLQEGGRP